jgi:transposase
MADLTFTPEIEVMPAGDSPRRRHWADADKLRIVEESFAGRRQVSATARRHGIARSLLTTWRRQYRNGELGSRAAPTFVPLTLELPAPSSVAQPTCDARIEIVLTNGRRMIVPADLDPEILARLLPAVEAG